MNDKAAIRYIVLKEDMTKGQRVERFQLLKADDFGKMVCFYEGTTIGFSRICILNGELLDVFEVRVLSSRDEADLSITIYG